MITSDLFRHLQALGVRIELKDGRVALNGPKDKLTPSLLKQIKERKEEIILLLQARQQYREFLPVAPSEKKDYYPVSPSQHRLFILQALQPASVVYNMTKILPLTGTIDIQEMKRIFTLLCHRHESMRTYFSTVGHQPVQRVEQWVDVKVEHSGTELTPIGNDALVKRFVRSFDLSMAPLWRLGLIKNGTNSYLLILDIHHIIADGFSISILGREIMEVCQGESLPPLRLQYRDFSQWQHEMARLGYLNSQRDFWLEDFREIPQALVLPTDFTRPASLSGAGKTMGFVVRDDSLFPLRALAKEVSATLFISLLAVFNILLSKLSGLEDIVVGVPVAGRNHTDLEGIVGMMVNTLPLRNFPYGSSTFRQFLIQVSGRAMNAFENQDFSLAVILSELRLPRELGLHPLFNVMFNLLNYADFKMKLPEPGSDDMGGIHKEGTAKFDLNLSAMEIQNGVYFELEYSSDLFRPRAVERFIGYFKRLLLLLPLSPDHRLFSFEMITDEERRLLLEQFNLNSTDYSFRETVSELFHRQVIRSPDAVALAIRLNDSLHISYMQLYRSVCSLAFHLKKKGAGCGSIVALVAERSFEMLVGILGILECGACYLPLDPIIPVERQRLILEDSGAPLAVCGLEWDWPGIETLSLREKEITGISEIPKYEAADRSLHDPAYVIYTSGSTGQPKGVLIEHHSLLNRLRWMEAHYSLGAEDIFLQKTPFSFDVSLWELLGWIVWGGRLMLLSPGGEKDMGAIVDAVSYGAVTHIHFIPSMLRIFIDFVKTKGNIHRLSSLKRVFCSGETLTKEHVAAFNQLFGSGTRTGLSNLYGPTEAAIEVSYYDCPIGGEVESVPIGKAIGNVRLYILDRYGNVQPPGVAGELYIAGIAVGRGYLNRPEWTAKFFVEDPFVKGGRMYRTGDLGRWSSDGQIEFLGRMDQQVKIRGYRIELQEIEGCLAKIPWIQDVVVSVESSTGSPFLCAYLTSDRLVKPFELRGALAKLLPNYMVPSCFMQLDEIPLNSNGKVDRHALPQPDLEYSLETYAPPRNKTEAEIAGFWREVMEITNHKIGIDDNFFQLGGDSIKANALNIKLFERFGIEIPMAEIFAFPTIRQQMEIINGRSSKN